MTNIAYNIMAGGTKLEDRELLRQDESCMDLPGAARIPDPTTAAEGQAPSRVRPALTGVGDLLRRFSALDVIALMDGVDRIRVPLWKKQPREHRMMVVRKNLAREGGEIALLRRDQVLLPRDERLRHDAGGCGASRERAVRP